MDKICDVSQIITLLKAKEIVIIPTDTLFGIASILDESAIQKIYDIKNRLDKPIAVLCCDLEQIKNIAYVSLKDIEIINKFMPGDVTLILKQKPGVPNNINKLNKTIAIRIPNDSKILEILKSTGPLATSSANISGSNNILSFNEVYDVFHNYVSGFLKGSVGGYASNIIDSTKDYKVLRKNENYIKIKKYLK